jgi:phenylpropionate dioxygenase-like ring-hydroxylating dioxygenase large terminal subunit
VTVNHKETIVHHEYPFPAIPNGWYVVGLSRELVKGALATARYLDTEIVLFRGEDGKAHAFDAWCPHLGAHFGHGGQVVGNTLRCPFHHFRFDGGGTCVEAPFVARIPPAARTKPWPVHEADGLIYVYTGPEAPTWTPPTRLGDGWSDLASASFRARFHPQEVAENSADGTHAVFLHGYLRPTQVVESWADGPFWNVVWDMEISQEYAVAQALAGEIPLDAEVQFAGRPVGGSEGSIRQQIRITACGLGVVEVAHDLAMLGWPSLVRFCLTPIAGGEIDFRVVTAVRPPDGTEQAFIDGVNRHVLSFSVRDSRQDVRIFEHKRYLARPAVGPEDGPIMDVRRWARQFYPAQEAR